MRFQRLRLSGFKSFVELTEFRIEPGLTGVVGPNGCGKSNLLEALRWVMGASSAKALRGGDMDDVIFGGTGARPSRNHAEVSLLIDNGERRAPAQFNHDNALEVVRRIERGAGSSYRVNGVQTRARDVQLLFADASSGANSPALVRQGQISELISAKPSNRRRILEEAAGIAGLQARRHEAGLRLTAAQSNLDRLDDVTREIDSGLNRLKREARLAERYRRLAAEIRTLQSAVLHARWADAKRGLAQAETMLAEANAASEAGASQAARAEKSALLTEDAVQPLRDEAMVAEAVVQRLRIDHQGLERDAAQARAELYRLTAELQRNAADRSRETQGLDDAASMLARVSLDLARVENEIAATPERLPVLQQALTVASDARAQAETEVERLAGHAAALLARRGEAKTRIDQARALLQAAKGRRGDAEARRNRTACALDQALGEQVDGPPGEAETVAARARLEDEVSALAVARRDVEAAELELSAATTAESGSRDQARTADDKLRRLRSEAQGLVQLCKTPGPAIGRPALDQVRAVRGFERAVAAAFGEDLGAGLEPDAPAFWSPAFSSRAFWLSAADPVPSPKWAEGATPLSAVMTGPEALSARMAMTAVVDREAGGRLQQGLPVGARLVSREGDLWRWDGFTSRADAPRTAAVSLAHRARLAELEDELEAIGAQASHAQQAHRAAQDRMRSTAERLRIARRTPEPLERRVASARDAVERHARDTARHEVRQHALDDRVTRLRSDLEEVQAAASAALADVEAARNGLAEAEALAMEPQNSVEEEALATARHGLAVAREAEADARADVQRETHAGEDRQRRRDALRLDLAGWTRRSDAAHEREAVLSAEQQRLETAIGVARGAPERIAQRLGDLLSQISAAEDRRSRAQDALLAAEQAREEADRVRRAADRDAALARERRAAASGRLDGAQDALAATAEQLRAAAGLEPEALAAQIARDAVAIPPDPSGLDAHLRALEGERDALGPVNLRAEDDVRDQAGRLNVLLGERADITAAIATLRDGVAALNQEGRTRLLAAFEIINDNFKSLFQTLFDGGQAELRLAESDDPLEVGLEIYACPPGKRLAVMSLMSGGEQALTATALILAVFLSSPAPICVLDEVDAPLDDANVDRFCRLLDEMRRRTDTRFIAITHNPVTMSRMDRLFGVTMREPGVSQLVSVDLRQAESLVSESNLETS